MRLSPEADGQIPLGLSDTMKAVSHFASVEEGERGAVFTKREVVEFILDLAGYTVDLALHECRLLEPSFGQGDFLIPAAQRLLTAYGASAAKSSDVVADLARAIRAVEVHQESAAHTRSELLELFREYDVAETDAHQILSLWIVEGDFLLVDLPRDFTHAVGNPPYVRQEMIPPALMAQYRARYVTIYDRADLYVPFIERCLTCLEPGGTLGFICADRWMKNKYGGPLRHLVATSYDLAAYVDMVDTDAFNSEVAAYPAITIIKRQPQGPTRVAHRPPIDREVMSALAQDMRAEKIPDGSRAREVHGVVKDREPWILEGFDRLALVRRLEADLPTLEEAGCKVGIGVATGADKVFIAPFESLAVESDRKLPLATTKDIEGEKVDWKGLGVVNPFRDGGGLVDLDEYPLLKRYFEDHADAIRKRNVAKRNPLGWYRTIDRIYPELANQPKLLIPDIKGRAHIVYEEGHLYPHHNLYFITSAEWDLKALQGVLRSGIAELFVSVYSTSMRGGYLRFQAQYLRRIRLPRWTTVEPLLRRALSEAANAGDTAGCRDAVAALYSLSAEEARILKEIPTGGDS